SAARCGGEPKVTEPAVHLQIRARPPRRIESTRGPATPASACCRSSKGGLGRGGSEAARKGYCGRTVEVGAPFVPLPSLWLPPLEMMVPLAAVWRPVALPKKVEFAIRTVVPATPPPSERAPAMPFASALELSSIRPPAPAVEVARKPCVVLAVAALSRAAMLTRPWMLRPKLLRSRRTRSSEPIVEPPTPGLTRMPPPDGLTLLKITESMTNSCEALVGSKSMPNWVKSWIRHFSTWSVAPAKKRMPFSPVPRPSMSRPRRVMTAFEGALTMMALVPETRTPAVGPSAEMVIDLVMVTPPKPPGSMTLISPPVAVLLIAPAKVLHGAVRLHGLASSPTPDTQVRVAWAWAPPATARAKAKEARAR